MKRDPFGLDRLYYDDAGRHARSVRALLEAIALRPLPELTKPVVVRFDRIAVAGHLGDGIPTDRSMFDGIRAVPPGHALIEVGDTWATRAVPLAPRPGNLGALLRDAIARALRDAPRPIAVALSGGLDSALVLAIARDLDPDIAAIVLDPRLVSAIEAPPYSELDEALVTARTIGVTPLVETITTDEFLAAVPPAIAAFEVPLYNLHPVSKWLLATRARAAGFATLLTGDGADQVMTRDVSADYLPLVGAAFDTSRMTLRAPFLDDDVIAHLMSLPVDPSKRAIREVAAAWPVPPPLVTEPKQSRRTPPLPLDGLVSIARIIDLARQLGLPAPAVTAPDRDLTCWTTLALLARAFGI